MNYLDYINTQNKIIKAQEGFNSSTLREVGDAASYMIPIYGTYKSIKDTYENPTLGNIGMAGLSVLGDIGTVVGAGALLKGAVAASRAGKVANAATKGYLAARATTNAARATAEASAKAANRAAGKVTSLTLQNAPTATIVDAQRAANAAKATAKTDNAAYRAASIAENGWDPVGKMTTMSTGSGTFQRVIPGGKFVGKTAPYSYKMGAEGVMDGAQNMARIAQEGYNTAKTNMVAATVGNVGAHASGVGINSSHF